MAAHFAGRQEPAYRASQVADWIYSGLAGSIDEMTNLPLREREALQTRYRLEDPAEKETRRSSDGAVKHLWELTDGEVVESVLIPASGRLTLCVSSQAGCAMACLFCATGWSGFGRQLAPDEIVGQYRASLRFARDNGMGKISNVVFMGMGEPLMNQKAVHSALTILHQGYGLGARRITVSTVGVVPGILSLARRQEQFRLALSLHAPTSDLRSTLVPLERRYPLEKLMDALEVFQSSGKRRITFEYTMIQGINDDPSLIPKIAELAAGLSAFVNLIPFNPIPYIQWRPSKRGAIQTFARGLEEAGVDVAVREPRGRDIDAACGQLRASLFPDLSLPGRRRGRKSASGSAKPGRLVPSPKVLPPSPPRPPAGPLSEAPSPDAPS